MYRQGDLLIVACRQIPNGCKSVSDNILLRGEQTGHAHKLFGEGKIYVDKNGELYIDSKKNVNEIWHEEHKTISIPQGTYKVVRQREYDEKEIRYVSD